MSKNDPATTDPANKPASYQTDKVVVRDDGYQTGTDTVTMGCKVPNGIVLRLFDLVDVQLNMNGMVLTEKQAQQREGEFVLNGFSIDLGKMAGGIPPEHQIIGGFGLTSGIPRDFAEMWIEQNKQSAMVRNGIVFIERNENEARAHARDYVSLQSGLQPVDPNDPSTRAGLRKGTITRDSAAA